jgi:hypothetical protein
MKKMNYIYSFGMIILGVFLLSKGFQDYREGVTSTRWPKAEGVITYSAAEDGHDSTSFVRIEYSYKVNEVLYKGDRIYAESFDTGMSRKAAEEIAMKFPVGHRGPVSYNPLNPDNSLLIPGPGNNVWLLFYGGIIFLIFGASYFFNEKRKTTGSQFNKI